MKSPNHILLDINKPIIFYSNQYWIFKYFNSLNSIKTLFNTNFHKKFLKKKENIFLNKLIQAQLKYTIKYNYSNLSIFLNNNEKSFINLKFQPKLSVKHRELDSSYYAKSVYDYLNTNDSIYDKKALRRLFKLTFSKNNINFQNSNLFNSKEFKSNNLFAIFNINFLKKEKMYTKLKYSRVPQYDIVSGGAAALLAAFLGFLITEKFGFELVDSADFYFVFMYLVFLFFSLRLFLKLFNFEQNSWNMISLKWLIFYIKTLLALFLNFLKIIFKFFK